MDLKNLQEEANAVVEENILRLAEEAVLERAAAELNERLLTREKTYKNLVSTAVDHPSSTPNQSTAILVGVAPVKPPQGGSVERRLYAVVTNQYSALTDGNNPPVPISVEIQFSIEAAPGDRALGLFPALENIGAIKNTDGETILFGQVLGSETFQRDTATNPSAELALQNIYLYQEDASQHLTQQEISIKLKALNNELPVMMETLALVQGINEQPAQ